MEIRDESELRDMTFDAQMSLFSASSCTSVLDLREERDEANHVIAAIEIPIFGRSQDGSICFANHAFSDLIDKEKGEEHSHAIAEGLIFHNDDCEILHTMHATGCAGEHLWRDTKSAPFREATGKTWRLMYKPHFFRSREGKLFDDEAYQKKAVRAHPDHPDHPHRCSHRQSSSSDHGDDASTAIMT